MPISLLSGPINSGKTAKVLDLLAACDPGRTGTVVVPDRATAADLRHRFSARFKGPFHTLRSDSIQDWASFIRSLANPGLPVATRQHSTLIVLGLLTALKLPYFGSSARSFGTSAGFARTILRLKENLVKPEDLKEIISGLGETRPRERDLIKVYEAYDKELSRLGLLDEADLTLLALARAKDALAGMQTIIFDEFAMPTPSQIAMLRAIGKGLKKAYIAVTCPLARGEEPFADWLARARETWLGVCDEEERLKTPKAGKHDVEVLKASSPAQEARHVALMVSKERCSAHDIVVATRPDDSFIEWYLSEAHSMELLPEHPTLDGARASPFAHELVSPDMIESLPSEASVTKYVEAMLSIADVKGRARGWISGLKRRRGHGRVAARSLAAAAIVEETLRSLSACAPLLGRSKITRDQFAQILSDELARRTAPATMLESVLPFKNLRLGTPLATDAARLIVPRMTEGSFPTRRGETLFFGDWKEESIRRIFPDAEDNHAHESCAFETMLEKCSGKVTLLSPAVNDAGSETIPSPFAARFLKPDEEPGALAPRVLDRAAPQRTRKEMERLYDVEEERIAGRDPAASPLAKYMGVLKSKDSRAIVRERFTAGEMSATALERYGGCPFSFFAQDVLRTREAPEDTPQIRGFDRGSVVHEILTRYYRDCTGSTRSTRGTGSVEKTIRKIAEEVWEGMEKRLAYVSPGLSERETLETADMALAVIAAEHDEASHISSPLTPREFEWKFGKEDGTALEIGIRGDEPLLIRGRVDRIDLDSDGSRFLVIDYKTGRKKEKQVANNIESGAYLQLPLYIDAVRRGLFTKALPLGGLLVEIREITATGDAKKTAGKTKGLVLKEFDGDCYRLGRSSAKVGEERLSELIEAAGRKSAEFASLIRKGIFPASGGDECRFCDYGDICRHKRVSAD